MSEPLGFAFASDDYEGWYPGSEHIIGPLGEVVQRIIDGEFGWLGSVCHEIQTMHTKEATLEEIFIQVTGRELVYNETA